MGLEAGTYIDDLSINNPDGGVDAKSQGDNHLRLIKIVLKNTLPGLVGRAWRTQSKNGNYTAVVNDNMTLLEFTAVATLSLTAAATLGNGHMFLVSGNGGGVTIDPNAAELINGAATVVVPDSSMALVLCTGSAFICFQLPRSGTFDAGTRVLFQQTSSPAGWTKEASATYNDASLRIVTGSVTTGGADVFSAIFGTGKNTGGFTLTTAHLPASGLSIPSLSVTASGTLPTDHSGNTGAANAALEASISQFTMPINVTGTTGTGTTGNMGAGGAHTHPLANFNMKFADCIIASKN